MKTLRQSGNFCRSAQLFLNSFWRRFWYNQHPIDCRQNRMYWKIGFKNWQNSNWVWKSRYIVHSHKDLYKFDPDPVKNILLMVRLHIVEWNEMDPIWNVLLGIANIIQISTKQNCFQRVASYRVRKSKLSWPTRLAIFLASNQIPILGVFISNCTVGTL